MRNNYLIIEAKINLSESFSEEERKKIFQDIYLELYDLRKRESDKPG